MQGSKEDIVLEVGSLSVTYQGGREPLRAVNDVSFKLARGEAFGLLGESGSGKSTVALSVLQYLPRTAVVEASALTFESRDLRLISASELRLLRGRRISAVYQHPGSALNPSLTIGRQVAEALIEHQGISNDAAKVLVSRALDRVRIRRPSEVLKLYPHELSGGMQQRVVLAMAMLMDPALIVLDEPTTALDANVQSEVVSLLNDLRRDHQTSLLLISHDVDLIAQTCDRVGVMQAGSIVEEGPVPTICEHPSHSYTKELLRSSPSAHFTKRDGKLGESGVNSHGQSTKAGVEARAEEHGQPAAALRVVDVSHSFGGQPVLSNVSFEVASGETFGLIGESGSGKSTLARIITGLQKPISGHIQVFDHEVEKRVERRSKSDRASVQMVFQSPDMTLNPRHRIRRILAGPMLRLAGLKRRDIAAGISSMVSSVRLPEGVIQQLPRALSGGQRQRVAIARAFAASPKIVVLDEPTSALDVSVQATVLNLLNGLQADSGTAYLFISHDLKVVRYMADKIGVLFRGRMLERGTADDIFNGPNHPYTRNLLLAASGQGINEAADNRPVTVGCDYASKCPVAMEVCFKQAPPDRLDGANHLISCWKDIPSLRDLAESQSPALVANSPMSVN